MRYLVPARERRRWATELIVALTAEAAKPQHAPRILPAYPRAEVPLRGEGEPGRSE